MVPQENVRIGNITFGVSCLCHGRIGELLMRLLPIRVIITSPPGGVRSIATIVPVRRVSPYVCWFADLAGRLHISRAQQ